jgi:hypothetical protein
MNENDQQELSVQQGQDASKKNSQNPNKADQNKKDKIHSEEMRYEHADDIY